MCILIDGMEQRRAVPLRAVRRLRCLASGDGVRGFHGFHLASVAFTS
jgi:hypothetical protein